MNQLFSEDLTRMIQVMEEYIITEEERLVELGFDGFRMDGRYGTMMSKAVRRFQDSRGLKITGEVNGPTWEALFSQESK